ncbi:hypothetical protein PthstB1num2_26830 [Parageobacillus thermoglucosidasius]|nr:hypothetical protein PthstB1num2_26830 [Parageobacillus thermoglucosidasius]
MTKQKAKSKKPKVIVVNDKTVIVEGIGKATDVGELDMRKFINVAMGLKSFWR